MHLSVIFRVTGTLLTLFSFTFLLPIIVALAFAEDNTDTFITAFFVTLICGLTLWLPLRGNRELRGGDGFLITALFYIGLGIFGAIPFYIDPATQLSFTDAAFESMSGLTTTGATILVGLDDLPKSLLFYRQLLQWFGGMGIIVLAVAIFPMLGIGGMQLYRTESPGPVKDNKLTPRITETAKALWYIYLGLTVACALAYWAAGMSLFDAVSHSFATVAIGGFSTHDASIGFFNSGAIEAVACLFMVLSGINFGLHFLVWRRRNPLHYFADFEVRAYLSVLFLVGIGVCSILLTNTPESVSPIRDGIFQTISITTTTGFVTQDFSQWPSVAPVLLLFAAFAGVTVSGIFDGGLGMVRGVARIAKTDNKYLTGKAAAGMAGAAAGDSVEMKEMKEEGGDDKGQDGSTGRAGEAGAAGGDDSQGGETKREDGADSEAKATLKAAKACGLHWEVHASWSHWSETMGVEWPMRVRQL